ncbi:MAG TPA: thiamine pyrophosphate-dependent enzyme [Acidimicrobiia bacterium]|nr:thiamine pyrophosphate-dependent enzyme [Acidimicrobiia bacterium]
MTATNGRTVLLEVLRSEGVTHCFGNPGTTELPFVDALADEERLHYVLALQENVAVAMADGYAQASGRPSFVNLHTVAGLGGGLGNLTNALANRTPMVVTAGQQDRRHLLAEPILSGDLTGLAAAASKWQHEVRHLDELAPVLRRAFLSAATPPTGPVFVSIPMDVLDETGDVDVPPRSHVERAAVAGGLEELAGLLAEGAPSDVALVVGDEIAAGGAVTEVVALAETLGARVYGVPLYSNLNFPSDHPLWTGMLNFTAAGVAGMLSPYRRIFVIGAKAFLVYPWTPPSPLPPGSELLHLAADPALVGRDLPTRFGAVGDIAASLAALRPLVAARVDTAAAGAALERARGEAEGAAERFASFAADRAAESPMHAMAATHALLSALPPGGALVDEAITTGFYVRMLYRSSTPNSYYFTRGGGLGWGVPAALGVKLARPDEPVLCIVGDGSIMYSAQALWTAAHEDIPVVIAVVNNRQYGILKVNLLESGSPAAREGRFVGMDLHSPAVDYVGLARSLGVDAQVVEKPADVTEATRAAFEGGRPALLELPIAPP